MINLRLKVLLLEENPTAEQLDLLGDYGTVTDKVRHLGVTIAKNYDEGRRSAYDAGKTAMKRAVSRITAGISSTNLIMKAQAVNTVVGAINAHRFRVYPPTKKETAEQWKIVRSALWTTSYFGKVSTRHKISQENVIRPVRQGGLSLIHPDRAASTAVLGSLASVISHSWKEKTSALNVIENPLRENWYRRLAVLNGKNVKQVFSNYKNIFPP